VSTTAQPTAIVAVTSQISAPQGATFSLSVVMINRRDVAQTDPMEPGLNVGISANRRARMANRLLPEFG
jgi:hypothetical protein